MGKLGVSDARGLLGASLAVLTIAMPAAAAESAAGSGDGAAAPAVGELIVTAQKRAESINTVGMSITAVTGEALASKGITDTADLVKIVPGFNFTQSSYGAPIYTLRGVGFYDTSLAAPPAVNVYVDEVPLPYSAMAAGALLDVQQVEVLKGPQGTLFGQNATGGAINYIAAKPTKGFEAGLDSSYSTFNTFSGKGFLSGPLSDTVGARLAVSYDHGDDWQRSYTRSDSLGRTDFLVGRLLVDWKPTDSLKVSVNLNGWRDRSDNQAAQFIGIINVPTKLPAALVAYPTAPGNDRAADWDRNTSFRRNNDFYQGSVRIDDELSFATLTSISSYEHIKRDGTTDADGTAVEDFAVSVPGNAGIFVQELRLAGTSGPLKWVAGANYENERIVDTAHAEVVDSSFPFDHADQRTRQRVSTEAVFGGVTWQVRPDLTFDASARYTSQDRKFTGCLYDTGVGDLAAVLSASASAKTKTKVVIPPGGCASLTTAFLPAPANLKLDEDNVSWRTGVNWQATSTALVYANISKGYKSGAFPVAGASFVANMAPAKQESVLAYEAGFKLGLLDRTVQLNGAVFYDDYRDKQIRGKLLDPILGPFNALVNVPKSTIKGAEASLNWRPIPALTLDAGATYVDAKIEGSFSNYNPLGVIGQFGGEQLPLTPKWQLTADADYHQALTEGVEGFVAGNVTYQSSTNAGFGNVPLLGIRSYTLVDARIGVRSTNQRWTLSVFAKNLGDSYYWTYVSTTSPDVAARLTGRPRTVGVSLGLRY